MKTLLKILLSFIVFSLGFYLLRTQGQSFYDVDALIADINGIGELYSAIGIIFAIFAAFVILFESERWNNLTDAVRGEVRELNELWLWSRRLPEDLKKIFHENITHYLEAVIEERLDSSQQSGVILKSENILASLHDDVYKTSKEAPELTSNIFSTFSDFVKYREQRVHYTISQIPRILKRTLLFSDALFVAFSFFIGVRNPWLGYILVTGVATLAYVIYLLVDDMDNPTRPGGWHLTTKNYQALLDKIKK